MALGSQSSLVFSTPSPAFAFLYVLFGLILVALGVWASGFSFSPPPKTVLDFWKRLLWSLDNPSFQRSTQLALGLFSGGAACILWGSYQLFSF